MSCSHLIALLACLPALLTAQPAPPTRPNILFIMSDDHAAQALSCYGSRINQTPNLDRIARQGMRLDHAFCTNSICSPVRAVNLTGKFSHRNGVLDNFLPFDGDQPTAPKMLREAGYQTAIVGKWHLKSIPTGFDFWKILPDQGDYYNPDFLVPGGRIQTEGYVTALITDFALDWLQKRDPNRPFFLMLHHKAPHRNWMPELKYLHLFDSLTIPEPPTLFDDYTTRSDAARQQEMSIAQDMTLVYDLKAWLAEDAKDPWNMFGSDAEAMLRRLKPAEREQFLGAYKTDNEYFKNSKLQGEARVRWKYQRYIKDYLRCVQSVDDQVGRVLDYLEQSGLAANTLVIYTSDQGFFLGEHGWFDKRFMYEESYRQPLLVQWPGVIPASRSNDALVMNVDFVPTFLEAAGVPRPADLQGESLLPLLHTGQTPPHWRDATYYHYYEYPGVHAVKRHYGMRTKRYKLIHFYYDIDAWELYDLEKDPQELHNVFDTPAYFNVRAALQERLKQLQAAYGEKPEDYLLHVRPDTAQHLARGLPCTFRYPTTQWYGADTLHLLTDGLSRDYSPYNAAMLDGNAGFITHPMDLELDLGRLTPILELGLHCRQQTPSWVHYPAILRFWIAGEDRQFRPLPALDITPEQGDGAKWFIRKDLDVSARYVRIQAEQQAEIPAGLPGAGKKAFLLADEVWVK